MGVHYLNGQWVTQDKLQISVLDLSVIRGFGVFDFLRTYDKKPFELVAHIDRLFHSAKILGIRVPETKQKIKKLVHEGIQKNSFQDYNIRIIVTGGVATDGITPGNPSFIIVFSKAIDYPQKYYEKGVKIITYLHKRAFPEAKSLDYLVGIVALQKAKKEQAIDALFVGDNGELYEGTTSNFFAVIKDKILTPPTDILFGITRKIVMDIAKREKIPVVEKKLFLKDIPKFDEAFITASNKEVMPVVRINEQIVKKGKVGAVTKQLMHKYRMQIRHLF